jgi:hypothetical protein
MLSLPHRTDCAAACGDARQVDSSRSEPIHLPGYPNLLDNDTVLAGRHPATKPSLLRSGALTQSAFWLSNWGAIGPTVDWYQHHFVTSYPESSHTSTAAPAQNIVPDAEHHKQCVT